jgi:alpha-glucoside transport system permease protein
MAAVTSTQKARAATVVRSKKQKGPFNPTAIIINGTLLMLVLAWLLPTIGLVITSVRTRAEIATSGWWTILPHQEYVKTSEFPAPKGQSSDTPITVTTPEGATVTATFAQFRSGVTASDGSHLIWSGNLRLGTIQEQSWNGSGAVTGPCRITRKCCSAYRFRSSSPTAPSRRFRATT